MKALIIASALSILILVPGSNQSQDGTLLLQLPNFTDTTLANGLRILIAEHHEQPAVFYRMLVKAGTRDEPAGEESIAELTAQMLSQGASKRTGDEIASAIDGIGGKLTAYAGSEYTTVLCDVLAENVAEGLDLFSSIILTPTFPDRDLDRLKNQVINEIEWGYTDPDAIALNHIRYLLFGNDHRIGRERTKVAVGSITVNDIRSFYTRYYLPNNAVLLVIGDVSAEDMFMKLVDRFGLWQSGTIPPRQPVVMKAQEGVNFRLVNKPDLTQGTIYIAHRGIEAGSPDRHAFQLMNYILGGGGFSSRLMTVIRSEGGKTYGISSSNEPHPEFGIFSVSTFTRNNEVARTITSIRSELQKMIDAGVTEEELKKAKSYYGGAYPMRFESPQSISMQVLNGLYSGFTIDDLRRKVTDLDCVTLKKVNEAATKYLTADSFALVVVGSADTTRESLKVIGNFNEMYYKDPVDK